MRVKKSKDCAMSETRVNLGGFAKQLVRFRCIINSFILLISLIAGSHRHYVYFFMQARVRRYLTVEALQAEPLSLTNVNKSNI